MRTAIVRTTEDFATVGDARKMADRIAAYLPHAYGITVVGKTEGYGFELVIVGTDVAGWTLDGYVLPRMASGMYYAEEVVPA